MKTINYVIAGVLTSVFLFAEYATAQKQTFEVPTTNPRARITQRVAATDIEVMYNRPSAKGRKIFGDLVPWGQVWRTGSDASTKISFSTPVSVNGQLIEAGLYEFFTIPGEKEWTIILQQNKNQWGSYAYKMESDVHRSEVQPGKLAASVETFTIAFDNVTSKSTELSLIWEKVKVTVQLSVDLKTTVVPQLEESLTKDEKRPYFKAAMFYFENDLDINRASELIAMALNENPNHLGMLYRQGLILERKGDVKGAIAASERSLAEAQKAGDELREEYVKLNTVLLARLKK